MEKKVFDRVLCAGTGHHLTDDELTSFHEILESFLSETGSLHFIDIVKTDEDTPIMKFLMAIDQGQHIRTSEQYFELFSKIKSLKMESSFVARADGWFTKASFVCLSFCCFYDLHGQLVEFGEQCPS